MNIGFLLPPGIGMCGGMRGAIEITNRLNRRGHRVILYWMAPPIPSLWNDLSSECEQVFGMKFSGKLDALVATEWRTAKPVLDAKTKAEKFYFIQHRESLWCGRQAETTYSYKLHPITVCRWLGDLMKEKGHKDTVTITPGFWHDLFWQLPKEAPGKRVLLEGAYEHPLKGCKDGWKAISTLDSEKWILSLYGAPNKGPDRVFIGPPQTQLRWIYSQCEVMLKPAISEAFPMPPAEAMACGCVPVVCDIPGMDDYCVDGFNCLKVPVGDIHAMRYALQRLLNDDNLRRRLADGGFETIWSDRFDWDKRIDEWEEVLSRS